MLHGRVDSVQVMMMPSAVTVYASSEAGYDQGHGIGTRKERVKDEKQKVFVIANSDTVVNPFHKPQRKNVRSTQTNVVNKRSPARSYCFFSCTLWTYHGQ